MVSLSLFVGLLEAPLLRFCSGALSLFENATENELLGGVWEVPPHFGIDVAVR